MTSTGSRGPRASPYHLPTSRCCLCLPLQLRNLLWATSAHDLYVVHENRVQHWSGATRKTSTILDVSGGVAGAAAPGLGQVGGTG